MDGKIFLNSKGVFLGVLKLKVFFIILVISPLSLLYEVQAKEVTSYWAETGRRFPEKRHELPFLSRRSLLEMIRSGQKVVFLDVREKREYEKEHLPRAVQMESWKIEREVKLKLTADQVIIPYCVQDFRAFASAERLKALGFPYVFMMMPHGLAGWKEQGLPTAGSKGAMDEEAAWQRLMSEDPSRFPKEGEPRLPIDFSKLPPGQVKRFSMTASDFRFKPGKIQVGLGDRVILEVKSIEGHHGIALPDFAVVEELPEDEEVTVEFIADKKGKFLFGCSEYCGRGHSKMFGELLVK